MWFYRVALLMVIYIAQDFATPMVPGAVQFVDGSLETDAGLYGRRANDLAPAVAPLRSYLSTVVPARQPTLQAGRVDCTPPPSPLIFRAPFELYSTPASSLDDD